MISFRLTIELIQEVCRFEWVWNPDPLRFERLPPAKLPYPETLQRAYQNWQRAYLSYYRTLPMPASPLPPAPPPFRGRVEEAGSLSPMAIDWHIRLGETEARLLQEFHYWLQSPELHPMRSQVAQMARTLTLHPGEVIEGLLTCSPELAYLPWEAWKIGDEFVAPDQIRLLRVPESHRSPVFIATRRRRPRVLAIWGDDTGLNFQEDREALLTLEKLADIHALHWQPDQTIATFKEQIRQAIRDPQGWDLLFFTGHSAETELT
ncbi:MAG: hypothetical protein SFW36_15295, partial [Leptolyngbyaceae cyanobacterium bins.59]|nr:hypothetical protein [Leptolyngbyaceae cyanobacterium bins.59]